jgi:hypothetical protein
MTVYDLWRQDDHGNKYLVERFMSREAADEARKRYEARGHKQTYWVDTRVEGQDTELETPGTRFD